MAMNSSTMIPPFEDKRKVAHIQRSVNHPMTVQQVYSVEDEEKKGQISRHLRYMATWLKTVGFRSDAPRWSVMPSQSLTEEFSFLLKCPGIVLIFGCPPNKMFVEVDTL